MGRLITALLVMMVATTAFAVDDWPMWRAILIQHVSEVTNYVSNTNLFGVMVYSSGRGRWKDFMSPAIGTWSDFSENSVRSISGIWLVSWSNTSSTGRSKLKWSDATP